MLYNVLYGNFLTKTTVQYLRLLSEEESDASSSNGVRRNMEHAENADAFGNAHHGGTEILHVHNFTFLPLYEALFVFAIAGVAIRYVNHNGCANPLFPSPV